MGDDVAVLAAALIVVRQDHNIRAVQPFGVLGLPLARALRAACRGDVTLGERFDLALA